MLALVRYALYSSGHIHPRSPTFPNFGKIEYKAPETNSLIFKQPSHMNNEPHDINSVL